MASPSQSKVCFFFDGVQFYFPNRTALKDFVVRSFRKEGIKLGGLNIIFCTDKRLLEINRSFLQHDYYTDIITFDLTPPRNEILEAEIYISIDRVKENAANHHTTFQLEIHRVIFHGVLHLCGFGDKSHAEQATMRGRETKLLNSYFGKIVS